MLNMSISKITPTTSISKTYPSTQNHGSVVNTNMNHSYDCVSISYGADNSDSFQKELVSRISQEIRTATTTGKIQELRNAVLSGEYKPDPDRIAKSILFQLEE